MPHRPADTRLLTALHSSTTSFAKALHGLQPSHTNYLTALTAFAASSSPPISTVLLQVSVLQERALEEGIIFELAKCMDTWKEGLEKMKAAEENVGRVGHDREILIGRVVKASSHNQAASSKKKDPHVVHGIASSSTLSLPSSKYSGASSGNKLSLAQNELLACEKMLSDKEVELRKLKIETVKDSLTAHFQGFLAISSLLNTLAAEGLQHVETLLNLDQQLPSPASSAVIVPHPKQSTDRRQSSDASSLSPSQSASQILIPQLPSPLQQVSTKHIYSDAEIVNPVFEPPALSTAESSIKESPPPSTPLPQKHILPRKITEENLSDSSERGRTTQSVEMRIVENPRFMKMPGSPAKSGSSVIASSVSQAHVHATSSHFSATSSQPKDRKGFMRSIRSLFTHRHGSRSPSPSKSKSSTLDLSSSSPPLPKDKDMGGKSKRKSIFGHHPPNQQPHAQNIFPTSSNTRDSVGLGIGLPPPHPPQSNIQPRKRVASDLTGSKRLKRRLTGGGRSVSNPQNQQQQDEWGDLIPRDSSDEEEEMKKNDPAGVVDAARMVREDIAAAAAVERERKKSFDRDSVKGWVESLPSTPSSSPSPSPHSGHIPKKRRSKSLTRIPSTSNNFRGEIDFRDVPVVQRNSLILPSSSHTGESGKLFLPTAPRSSLSGDGEVAPRRRTSMNKSSEREREEKKERHKSLPMLPLASRSSPHLVHTTTTHGIPSTQPSYHTSLHHTRNDLLSIVESAQPHPAVGRSPGLLGRRKSVSQSHLPLPYSSSPSNPIGGSIDIPHAPRPVGRGDLERMLRGDSGSDGSSDKGRMGSNERTRNPSEPSLPKMVVSHPRVTSLSHTHARSSSAGGEVQKGKLDVHIPHAPGSAFSSSSSSSLVSVNGKPLKSALKRDSSLMEKDKPLVQSQSRSLPVPNPPPRSRARAGTDVVKQQAPADSGSSSDDAASMESFETGREMMDGDGSHQEEEEILVTPKGTRTTPHDENDSTPTRRPLPARSPSLDELNGGVRESFFSAMDVPWSEDQLDAAAKAPNLPSSRGNRNASPTTAEAGSALSVGVGADDEGSTETETEKDHNQCTPSPPPPPPKSTPRSTIPPHISTRTKEPELPSTPPTRRKSVRVSLKPTFSATPPALDDDEDNDEWKPWSDKGEKRSGGNHSDHIHDPPMNTRSGREQDIWEDSSDEDEEYVRARRLLAGGR